MNTTTPARGNVIVLKQLLNLIPRGMINRLAIQTGVHAKACTFSVTSHLAAMIFAQLARTVGLNDVCDWLRLKAVEGRRGQSRFSSIDRGRRVSLAFPRGTPPPLRSRWSRLPPSLRVKLRRAGVMARGEGGKDVFEDETDRTVWLSRLGEVCGSYGWRVHAWVMMGNHFD